MTQAVDSPQSFAIASEVLKDVKYRLKTVEAERKRITKPLRESLDAANAFFGRVAERYELAETALKARIGDYLASEARREAAAIAGATDHHVLALATQSSPTAQGISAREKLTWVVEDINAIPDDCWQLDEKKIGAIVRAGGQVPGVRVTKSVTIAVRTQ